MLRSIKIKHFIDQFSFYKVNFISFNLLYLPYFKKEKKENRTPKCLIKLVQSALLKNILYFSHLNRKNGHCIISHCKLQSDPIQLGFTKFGEKISAQLIMNISFR